jgi:hypothetical protein
MAAAPRWDARRCPWCGEVIDESDGVLEGQRPKAGDCSVCFGCLRLGVFTAPAGGRGPLGLRRATPAEAAAFLARPELARVLALVRGDPLRKVRGHQDAMAHVEGWRDLLGLDAAALRLAQRARRRGGG